MDALPRWLRGTEAWLAGWTLVAKFALLVFGLVVVAVFNHQPMGLPGFLGSWNRWDAPHYLDVAVFGYTSFDPGDLPMYSQPGDLDLFIVFYPLFPAAVALGRLVVNDPVAASFLVSALAAPAASVLLYRLVKVELGERVATRAAWFLLIFPTAYFLHIGYTESLFLALVLGSLLAARGERWWLAGALGGLAALTRVNGLLLIPALAAEAWLEWRRTRRVRAGWAWIGLVAAGFGVYLLINQLVYGDPLTFLRILREHWDKSLAWPWQGVAGNLRWISDPHLSDAIVYGWAELAGVGLGLAASVVAALRFRTSWFAWTILNWLLFVSTSYVLSTPRYALTLFPMFAWFGLLAGRGRGWLIGLSAVSIVLLGLAAGRFAAGQWAF